MTVNFLSETMEARGGGITLFKCWKKRTDNPESYIQEKYPTGMKRKSTHFSNEEKLREFVASRLTLREWLIEVL